MQGSPKQKPRNRHRLTDIRDRAHLKLRGEDLAIPRKFGDTNCLKTRSSQKF